MWTALTDGLNTLSAMWAALIDALNMLLLGSVTVSLFLFIGYLVLLGLQNRVIRKESLRYVDNALDSYWAEYVSAVEAMAEGVPFDDLYLNPPLQGGFGSECWNRDEPLLQAQKRLWTETKVDIIEARTDNPTASTSEIVESVTGWQGQKRFNDFFSNLVSLLMDSDVQFDKGTMPADLDISSVSDDIKEQAKRLTPLDFILGRTKVVLPND